MGRKRKSHKNQDYDDDERPVEDAKATTSELTEDSIPDEFLLKKKRKLHTFEKAKIRYDAIKAEKQRKFERKQQQNIERMEALSSYNERKKKTRKTLLKSTRKGQPKMGARIEILLDKIERNLKKDT